MKIIGVTGLNGSGKDEVVKYLNQRYGVPIISIGDIVREIAARENIEPTRENLDSIITRYFRQSGEDYFLKLVVEKIRQNRWETAGISGIRSPGDVAVLRKTFGDDFILVHVYVADPQVRYSRIRERGSKRDELTYEEFLRQDKVSEDLFHIRDTINEATYSIPNQGTLEDLHQEVDRLAARLL